jgi:hypothetical protein
MAFILKLARLITSLNDAFAEAMEARRLAGRKHPHVPDE